MITTHHIYIGSDHAGYALKQYLLDTLKEKNFIDCGVYSDQSSNYALIAHDVALKVKNDPKSVGIIICGTGIGVSIAANRHPGIRAALCHNADTAKTARLHNDANILALGARIVDEKTAFNCVKIFLDTPFEGGRHEERVSSIDYYGEKP
jgi:ribose 5-phosphate isomerase B